MIILAESPNDKGKQLEELTKRLLEQLGYVNCAANMMANGAEIDVVGEYEISRLPDRRTRAILCECKALKDAVDITQWCKFLGKVYHHETTTQKETSGCLISLKGVNGHVQSNYNEFRKHKDNISLLHGDSLFDHVSSMTNSKPLSLQGVNDLIRRSTPRPPIRFEAAYHHGRIYWVVVFSNNEFSIIESNGEMLNAEFSGPFTTMIEKELGVSTFVDLGKESLQRKRASEAKILALATMFTGNGSASANDFTERDGYLQHEQINAANALVHEALVEQHGDMYTIPKILVNEEETVSSDLYQILLQSFPLWVLPCNFYQTNINRAFLNQVARIQEGFQICEEFEKQLIEVLRLSPCALKNAINPMDMIVVGRKQGHTIHPQVETFHQNHFRKTAFEALARDFRTPALADFYFNSNLLCEIEICTQIILKSPTAVASQASFNERLAIKKGSHQLLNVILFPDSEQPWK